MSDLGLFLWSLLMNVMAVVLYLAIAAAVIGGGYRILRRLRRRASGGTQ